MQGTTKPGREQPPQGRKAEARPRLRDRATAATGPPQPATAEGDSSRPSDDPATLDNAPALSTSHVPTHHPPRRTPGQIVELTARTGYSRFPVAAESGAFMG
ncbi:hypothetical protein AB0D61_14745, partial [Streptomyces sp. NPDC048341]